MAIIYFLMQYDKDIKFYRKAEVLQKKEIL